MFELYVLAMIALAAAQPDHRAVQGRVVDLQGQAVAGAKVVVIARVRQGHRGGDFSQQKPLVLAQSRCDADGRYDIPLVEVSSSHYLWVQLLAGAEGYGLAWRDLNADDAQHRFDIALSPAREARGRLITLEGRPAAGVQVLVDKIGTFSSGEFHGVNSGRFGIDAEVWPQAIKTDGDGWFVVPGLPPDAELNLYANQEPYAPHWWVWKRSDASSHVQPIPPAQVITGVVVAADTGQPVPQARLTVFPAGGGTGIDGQTDQQGRFRLNPFPSRSFSVAAFAPQGTNSLSKAVEFKWPPTAGEHSVRIELPRGVLLRGTILEKDSGRPLPQAKVVYAARYGNPYAKGIVTGWQSAVLSDAHGRFAVGVPAGPGYVIVQGSGTDHMLQEVDSRVLEEGQPGGRRQYVHAHASFDLPADAQVHAVQLMVQRGVTVRGTIVGADGAAPDKVLLLHRWISAPLSDVFRGQPRTLHGGTLELRGVPADGELPIFLLDSVRKQGALVNVRGQAADVPLAIKLQQCGSVTFRYVDGDGKPLPGKSPSLRLIVTPGPAYYTGQPPFDEAQSDEDFVNNIDRLNCWNLKSGEDGRATVPTLIPGALYRTVVDDGTGGAALGREIRVKPGEHLMLPDVVIREAGR